MFKAHMQNDRHLRSALDAIPSLWKDKAFSPAVGYSGIGGQLEKRQRRVDIHVRPQKVREGWVLRVAYDQLLKKSRRVLVGKMSHVYQIHLEVKDLPGMGKKQLLQK